MKSKHLILLFALAVGVIACSKDDECELSANLSVDRNQLSKDVSAIDKYLSDNSIQAEVHDSGLRYVIKKAGSGNTPTLCNDVSVTYKGMLMSDGSVFDHTSTPVTFGLNQLITGWQVGIPLIQTGGSITLYIPSVYAYGSQSGGGIPANSNLIFDIDLVGIN